MAWIELHQTLPSHRKTMRLANMLGIKIPQAVGHVCLIWLWSVDNAPNGDLSEITPKDLASIAAWTGRKPDEFVNALVLTGFLDNDMKIHDWDQYAGRLIESRKRKLIQDRERQQRRRATLANTEDVTRDSNVSHTDVTPLPNPTVPYHIDDDGDNDVDLRAYAREGSCDEWEVKYADADKIIQAAYRSAVGHAPTSAEVNGLARIAVLRDKTALIAEAIYRAAAHGAKAIVPYVSKIIDEWTYQMIDTTAELAEYTYLMDCVNGKIPNGLDALDALDKIKQHREAKQGVMG